MFQSRPGRAPALPLKLAATATLLLLTLASSGCSSTHHTQQPSWATGPHNSQQAAAETSRRPDLEDDGLEAQVPPPPTIRLAPDDPSEPFSPNYGVRPPAAPDAAQPKPASQPQPLPSTRPTTTSRPKFAGIAAD